MVSKNEESDNETANPIPGPSNPAKESTSDFTPAAATASNQLGAFTTTDEFYSPEFDDDITPSQPPPKGNSSFDLHSPFIVKRISIIYTITLQFTMTVTAPRTMMQPQGRRLKRRRSPSRRN